MNILILLLNFLIPTADAALTECTGGATGTNYGNITCTVPVCNIAINPSLGCIGVTPPVGGPLYGYRCYLTDYINKVCTYDTITTTCYPITAVGFTNFCAAIPLGKSSPSPNPVQLTNNNTVLNCRELSDEFMEQFCKVW